MFLDALDKVNGNIKVVLIQSPSVQLILRIQDKIRAMLGTTRDTLITLEGRQELSMLKSVQNVEPLFSERWLVLYDYGRKPKVKLADVLDIMKSSTTVVYFVTVENYKYYREVKNALRGIDFVYDFYLPYLNRINMGYLYYDIVSADKRMTTSLYDFVCKNYSRDVDAVMTLFGALAQGYEVKKQTDVTSICGLGSNTIENFVFSLLQDPPTSKRGLDSILKKRLTEVNALAEIYSYHKLYNFALSTVRRILSIKELRISGAVYKRMDSLPAGFDDQHLEKLQKYLWKINKIPTTRILRLYHHLSNCRWSDGDLAFQKTIYTYFLEILNYEVIPKLHFETEEEAQQKEIEKARKELEKARIKDREAEKQFRLKLIQEHGYLKAMQMLKDGVTSSSVSSKPPKKKSDSGKSSAKAKTLDTSSDKPNVITLNDFDKDDISTSDSSINMLDIMAKLSAYKNND